MPLSEGDGDGDDDKCNGFAISNYMKIRENPPTVCIVRVKGVKVLVDSSTLSGTILRVGGSAAVHLGQKSVLASFEIALLFLQLTNTNF